MKRGEGRTNKKGKGMGQRGKDFWSAAEAEVDISSSRSMWTERERGLLPT